MFALSKQTTTKTISTLCAEMLTPTAGGKTRLNLTPTYQRARCWGTAQNDMLIDSVMRGLVIPLFSFYTLHSTNEADAEDYATGIRYECVDGQNRLCALAAFLSGKPILNDKGVPIHVTWRTDPRDKSGRKFSDLSEEEQEHFRSFDLPLVIVKSPMSMDARKVMFTRLQEGTKISTPEYLRNSKHPVSKFVAHTNLRDTFLTAINGHMTGGGPKGDWLFVIADCVTLYLNRSKEDRYSFLHRDTAHLKRVLACKEAAQEGTSYAMEVTTPDYEPLMALFRPLIAILETVKAEKVKYHKFYVVVLFHMLLTGEEIPSPERLCIWFQGSRQVKEDTDAKIQSPVIYARLQMELAAAPPAPPSPKPKRRAIPAKKRVALWCEYFGDSSEGICQCCQDPMVGPAGGHWEQGHIVAVAAGGSNDLSNLVPICFGCNRSCGEEDLREYAAREYPTAPFLRS